MSPSEAHSKEQLLYHKKSQRLFLLQNKRIKSLLKNIEVTHIQMTEFNHMFYKKA